MEKKRPNMIIINPDEMRADVLTHLGCEAIETKNMDALAADGMSFSGAFCQNPVCVPSRCSFMSGWYPHVAGHRTMNFMLQEHEPVLLRELKENGYHVWMNSRNDLLPAQVPGVFQRNCDTYYIPDRIPQGDLLERWRGDPKGDNYYGFLEGKIEPQQDMDQLWVDGAVKFIENYEKQQPFCLFLPLNFPHPPYKIWEPYYSGVDREKMKARILPPEDYQGKCKMMKALHEEMRLESWSDEKYQELRAVYLGMCLRVDDLVGQVIAALKAKGIYEDSAIFFFSDHGDYAGDYNMVEKQQNSFEDALTRVPFVVKLPKELQLRRGKSDELVELIDFYATAADLAQLPPTHTQFGQTLLPFAAKQTEHLRDGVVSEGGFRMDEEQCRKSEMNAPPPKSHKYYPRISLQMSREMYNGKAVMYRTKEYKYVHRLYEEDELYDLKEDPKEVCNLIHKPEYQSIAADLRERLLSHYLDTSDVVSFQMDARFDRGLAAKISARAIKRLFRRPISFVKTKTYR